MYDLFALFRGYPFRRDEGLISVLIDFDAGGAHKETEWRFLLEMLGVSFQIQEGGE